MAELEGKDAKKVRVDGEEAPSQSGRPRAVSLSIAPITVSQDL